MDLLLFLVGRREVDVYDVPLADITEEYFEYLVLMEVLDIELAGEFLVMAASLMVIKARTLPRRSTRPSMRPMTTAMNRPPRGLQHRLAEMPSASASRSIYGPVAHQDMVRGREGAGPRRRYGAGCLDRFRCSTC